MKHSSYFFIVILFLFAQCKKDNELDYPDLSDADNYGELIGGNGFWAFIYQGVDSISSNGIVYLDKNWPSNGNNGNISNFRFVKISSDNRKYLYLTKYVSWLDGKTHVHIDTVVVFGPNNLIRLNMYNAGPVFSDSQPYIEGVFWGGFNSNTKTLEGLFKHQVYYKVGASEVRSAVANVNAYCY